MLAGEVATPLMQLALDHFTFHLQALVGLAVHSVSPPRREGIDARTPIIIAHLLSDALGLLVETAPYSRRQR